MSMQDVVESFRQRERQEGFAEALIELYTERFGAPPNDVATLISRTHDRAALRTWLKLAAHGSAEEVLAAIRSQT